nr:hypothetical protein [Tanacetum cinerariifolium]
MYNDNISTHHDFFDVKASDLSSDHSVGGYYTARMVRPYMDSTTDFALDLSSDHGVGGYYTARMVGPYMDITIDSTESSSTREYLSLIHTFFLTHTIGGVFLNPTDKALYDEMLRLQGLGSYTSSGVPYTEDEIMAIVRRGKQRGHIPGVDKVLPGQGTVMPPSPPCTHSSDVAKPKKREKLLMKKMNIGSGGCEDEEPGDDKDDGEDGEDDDDSLEMLGVFNVK